MVKFIYLTAGGAAGAFLRYIMSNFVNSLMGIAFPYGTLVVNLAGSFLIGLMWGLSEIMAFSPNLRMFLFVGFLGSFTTFSTFALESISYLRDNNTKIALLNLLISNIAGLTMVFLGILLSKYFISMNN